MCWKSRYINQKLKYSIFIAVLHLTHQSLLCDECRSYLKVSVKWVKWHEDLWYSEFLTHMFYDLFSVLEMKIWIYWCESNAWIYFYLVLNKNWKIYWSKQSLLVLSRRTGGHSGDCISYIKCNILTVHS